MALMVLRPYALGNALRSEAENERSPKEKTDTSSVPYASSR